jgi:peptide/nickel transport system permease protein
MRLIWLILGRLAAASAILFAVAALVFAATTFLPGDVAGRVLGRNPDPQQLEILRARLGLDQPPLMRFVDWFTDVLRGDLGVSLVSGQPVAEIISHRLANSAWLAALALALYVPIAAIPAILQALRPDGWRDQVLSILSLCLVSVPDFLLATGLLILFALTLGWAPAHSTIDSAMSAGERLAALALPALTVAIVMGTYAARYLRDSLIEILQSDFIRMARLNGVSEVRILWRHALPNALVPALNITALNLTYLFGGVVVIEQVFGFPGFGALMVAGLMQLDIPVVQATVVIAAAAYVLGTLAADLAALALNPRLRDAA